MNFEEFYILMPVRVSVDANRNVCAIETPAIGVADDFVALSAPYETVNEAKEDFDTMLCGLSKQLD